MVFLIQKEVVDVRGSKALPSEDLMGASKFKQRHIFWNDLKPLQNLLIVSGVLGAPLVHRKRPLPQLPPHASGR